jgi:hypothetical protein
MHVKHQRFGEFILRFWLKRGSSWWPNHQASCR